jgi:purine-binding chemotaxis protein CheW
MTTYTQPLAFTSPSCLLVFEIAGESFAIPLDTVREILPLPLLSHPPGIPSFLEGFLNLGGQAIPVLNATRLFRLQGPAPSPYAHLVVLETRGMPLAVLADRAAETTEVPKESVMPVGQSLSFNDCLEGDARIGGRTVHMLSVEKLLLEEERRRIAELRAMEQERLRELEESPR